MLRSAILRVAASLGAFASLFLVGSIAAPTHGIAQQVVARVNGDPITAVDVAQRSRLIQASTRKAPSQKEVLDELIDEQLKVQTARRYKMEISDADVDNVISGMASRMRATPAQFAQALGGSGISINALKRKIRADLAWNQIVRGKFHGNLQVREREVAALALSRKKGEKDAVSYEYTLRPILLVVPRGAGEGAFETRRREADALRNRFQNCEEGLRLARGLRDVAVRDQIIRSSGDLSAKLREVLDATEVGRVTPPDITPQGVEVFALCDKKQAKGGDSGAERDVREELFGERFSAQGKQYLQQLRRSASIEFR